MLTIATIVAPSPIDGLGVFAATFVPEGKIVWVYNPDIDSTVPRDQLFDREFGFLRKFGRYSKANRHGCLHDGDNSRFLNHSDRPNISFVEDGLAIALRDICAGEEIVCEYDQFLREIVTMSALTGARNECHLN